MECLGLDYPCVLLGKGGSGGGDPIENQRGVTVFVNGLDKRSCQRHLLIMAGVGSSSGQHLRPVGLNLTWFLLFWCLCSLCRGAPCKEWCAVQRTWCFPCNHYANQYAGLFVVVLCWW